MKTVKYEFPYLNVRVDYCGDPVINAEEPKKIRFNSFQHVQIGDFG